MGIAIYEPGVFRFTKPAIDAEGIQEWIAYNGYTWDEQKVLFRLIEDMESGAVTIADGLSELCARFCYRAWKVGRPTKEHIANIIEGGHGSVFAHVSVTFVIQGVSRTLTHELVRHHVGVNPSQESQRYVDAKDMNFVVPPIVHWAWNERADSKEMYQSFEELWMHRNEESVRAYIDEQSFLSETLENANPFDDGEKLKKRINEAARCHLPGCAETRLTWTMNLRAARDILGNPSKRGSEGADLEIRRLALRMLKHMQKTAPIIFQDFEEVRMPVVNGIKSVFGGV